LNGRAEKYLNYFALALDMSAQLRLFWYVKPMALPMNENWCPQHQIKGPNLINSAERNDLSKANTTGWSGWNEVRSNDNMN
jgi:hypothetical protein